MLFSERMGITSPKSMIQLDSMDEALKNSLWNNLCLFYFDKIRAGFSIGQMVDMDRTSGQYVEEIAIARFVKSLWLNFFKKPFDVIREKRWSAIRDGIRSYFLMLNGTTYIIFWSIS